MPLRWGLGPVFAVESRMNARRPIIYAGRSLFVLVLLAGLVIVWARTVSLPFQGTTSGSLQGLASVGEYFYYTLTMLQLALVLLAAPAATAGAICLDRARGGLAHLLVTDLSDAEIVLGKLAAQLAPIVAMLACSLPVNAMATLLGGIDVGALTGAFVVSLAVALLGCSLAMTLSTWATKTHEVILAVFVFWTLALLSLPIWVGLPAGWGVIPPPDWFAKLNPFILIAAPYGQPGFVSWADYAIFSIAAIAVSALLNGVTIATLRRSMAGLSDHPRRAWRLKLRRFMPGPSLDGNPVLWREWHRNRPSRLARFVWTLFVVASLLGTIWGLIGGPSELMTIAPFQVGVGLLMASISAPMALSEERVRGSLDLLLATPLSTRSIVVGKWLGAFRLVPWLAVLPILAAAVIGWEAPDPTGPGLQRPFTILDRIMVPILVTGLILASGAAITSLGLALALWIPRVGRSVGLSVSAYLMMTLGWPLLIVLALMRQSTISIRSEDIGVVMGLFSISPMAGSFITLEWLLSPLPGDSFWATLWIAQGTCILAASAFAAALIWYAIRTFDRRLGRVSERPRRAATRVARPEPILK